ncbi:MAG: hypothetical protein U0841_18080 [Chloroflexia bacterium]
MVQQDQRVVAAQAQVECEAHPCPERTRRSQPADVIEQALVEDQHIVDVRRVRQPRLPLPRRQHIEPRIREPLAQRPQRRGRIQQIPEREELYRQNPARLERQRHRLR